MGVNSNGYVPLLDFGAPRVISGRAREVISGGELVFVSGANNSVTEARSSFSPKTDLLFATGASGLQFNGIAMHNAESGAQISVAIDGAVILTADAACLAGHTVLTGGNHEVRAGTTAGHIIGRSLTSAASGGQCVVHLQG